MRLKLRAQKLRENCQLSTAQKLKKYNENN